MVMDRFDLEKFCQLVQEYKITYSYVVPPVILLLAKSPAVLKYDLSSLRMLNSGAAPLTRELVEAVWNRLKIPVKQGMPCLSNAPSHTYSGRQDTAFLKRHPPRTPNNGTCGSQQSVAWDTYSPTCPANIAMKMATSSLSAKPASCGSKVPTSC